MRAGHHRPGSHLPWAGSKLGSLESLHLGSLLGRASTCLAALEPAARGRQSPGAIGRIGGVAVANVAAPAAGGPHHRSPALDAAARLPRLRLASEACLAQLDKL